MNAHTLKNKIKKKFGTLSNFARTAGIDRYNLQKQLASPHKYRKELKALDQIATKISASNEVLPVRKLEALKKAINAAGGTYKFCGDHPEFNRKTVYQILQGGRRRMSPVITKLLNHFNL